MNSLFRSLQVLGAATLLLAPQLVDAQAPANDLFANAIPINGPIATVAGNNVGATKRFGGGGSGEPALVGNFGGANVWWTWTATASGPTTIDTMGSSFNTLLGVHTGDADNALTAIASNNDFNANTWSRVEFIAVGGTTYRIQVDGLRSGPGFGTVATGSIVLNVMGVGGLTLTPASGAVFTVGEPIPMVVAITPDFPNPPVTRVEFFARGSRFASVSNAPYTAVAVDLLPGTNSLHAVAYDSLGMPVQSPIANVLVQNVGVTLLAPAEDAVFAPNSPINVSAWAYLPGGAITNIEFFANGVKVAEDDSAPYSVTLSNLAGGSQRLTAVGRSDSGARFTSQAVNIGVIAEISPFSSVWRYLDDGSDQGTAWKESYFVDTSWASGPAPLGYADSNGRLPATTNSFGPSSTAKFITTYYRQAITVSNAARFDRVRLNIERDDGAVVYLNGIELARFNMPTGAVTSATLATSNAGDDGAAVLTLDFTPSLLPDGINVFAVEIHQDAIASSDIWFQMSLQGLPIIIHNLSPVVALTNPPASIYYLAPLSIDLAATASDADGSVARVEFFADGIKFGEDLTEPYAATWNTPSIAAHVLTAVATDDQGATSTSDEIPVVVYDAAGTPVAAITSPVQNFVTQGPTNWLVTATANAITGVTNVEFLANGVPFANDAAAPYSAVWIAPFGTNLLTAVATDATGVRGTSPVVTATITIPPTNLIAPTVASRLPLALVTVTNLTNITVTFSENVQNVDAADLLINGVPAVGVSASHSTSNYTFGFPRPANGTVNISWADSHGITDYGFPTVLPFDRTGPGANWSYNLIDQTPPTVATRTPAAGATVTNLSQISIGFNEAVSGVDAADLLLNGAPALSVSGSGSNYTFNVSQPAPGTLSVTWATNHGIFDLALTPNAFNRSNTVNNWSFTLDTRVVLAQSNSVWRFVKGTNETSSPVSAWRQPGYNDAGWSNAPAPFFYGETSLTNVNIPGTTLSDMQTNYTSISLRKEFVVLKRGEITSVSLNAQVDDGFIAWINGVEVARVLMPAGEVPYTGVATAQATEPANNGAAYTVYTLNNAVSALVDGTNILAIQAFNQNLTNSSDFSFNAQLYYFPLDATTVAARLLGSAPVPGDVFSLTNVAITFSEGVSGVNAADLLVNGTPVTGMTTTTNTTYAFSFPQPAYGNVVLTWVTNIGIADFDNPPKSFDGASTNSILRYFLINPSNPRIASQMPAASSTVTGLTSVAVIFTEAVSGVSAPDLLVAGTPATGMASADNVTYNFTFLQPAFGAVTIRWATNHGIVDVEAGNGFDPTRFGGQWSYTLIDPVPSVALTSPTNNTFFLPPANLTLRATATDNDGTVALVEFYQDATKLGEGTNAPYLLGVSNLSLGTYSFRAVATDNSGLVRTSAPAVVNVVTSLPITLVRGPYLQSGSPTGAVVRWRTQVFSDSVVRYGLDPATLTNEASVTTRTNDQIVTITGLEPDTKYFYSIGNAAQNLVGGADSGQDYWFKTSPAPGTRKPTRLWILGDAGTAGNGAPDRQRSTRDAYHNWAATNGPADLWLMLGDNAYNSGTDAEHQAAVFDMYPTTLRNLFLWPTIGNHETAQSTTVTDFPYLNIFSLPKGGEAGGQPSGTELYYSFDYANIHFVCLNTMTSGQTGNTPMANWLRADLEAASAEWIIVFFHHPPYTKGSHNSDTEQDLVAIRQNLVPIMEAHGVDLVLSGHSHCYERSVLLNGHYGFSGTLTESMKVNGGNGREDGDGPYRKTASGEGTVYTVAGSSGQATFLQADAPLPAMQVTLLELGSMIVDVSGNRLDGRFLRENGTIQDAFTLIKPSITPLAPLNLVAVPTGPTEISLFWTAGSTNQLGYSLQQSTDGVNFTEIFALPPEANNALNSGLLTNATYFYRVRATNALGASDYSNIASASTVMPTSAPRAPAGLVAHSGDGVRFFRSQMVLSWLDRSTNEAGFQIERTADGSSFVPVATVAANHASYLDQNLDTSTYYLYRVRAINALGLSAASNLAGDETHPQSQFAREGETVIFHAGSEGVPPVTYQWRLNSVSLTGQTSETLVLTNVLLASQGEYSVVIRDGAGTLATRPASLVVVAPPRIVTQPLDSYGVAGTPMGVSATATGTSPFTYYWRKNGAFLSGANSPSLLFPSVLVSDAAGYDLVVENDFGTAISRVATLSVYTLPQFAPVLDVPAQVLRQTVVSNFVHDSNSPPLQLTFSMAPGAPTNARINSTNGRFNWTPTRAQAPSTNPITVRVVDPLRSLLSNQMTFNVIVNDYVETTVGSPIMMAGTTNFAPIDFYSSLPVVELQTVLKLSGARLTNLSVEAMAPALATVNLLRPDSNTAAVTITAATGTSLQGTQRLARLHFTAEAGQTSAFVPLRFESILPIRSEPGMAPTVLTNNGRAVVINAHPLVDGLLTNSARQVVVYGRTGTTYQVQYSTNLMDTNWYVRASIPMLTNLSRSLFPGNTPHTNHPAYFRAFRP